MGGSVPVGGFEAILLGEHLDLDHLPFGDIKSDLNQLSIGCEITFIQQSHSL